VTTIGCGEVGDGLAADLLGAALASVNWDEIAEHYVEDAIRNEAEQTEYANA
jgi:3-hydroxyisobutyrate dehydrogenase-like beta-hydroxyacid dehydrogenase